MAIDMIEDNELSALGQSRLGNKTFINDDRYANLSYTSKREKERRKQSSIAQVKATWGIDPKYANDCEYLQTRAKMLDDEIENQLSKNPSSTTMDRLVNPLKDVQVGYKNAITLNKCVERLAEYETKQTKKETLEAITSAASTPPSVEDSAKAMGSSNATKYVIYGVAGLTLVIVMVALLRKN